MIMRSNDRLHGPRDLRHQGGVGRIEAGLRAPGRATRSFALDAAGARRHQHDAAGEERRFVDRVGDEHHRAAGRLPQRQQIRLQPVAGELVERGERFVHQQQARPRHQGARDRHPHAHAAGKLPRARASRTRRGPTRPSAACTLRHRRRLRHAAQTQRQEDVVLGGGPGQQGGVLEHEADVARCRRVAGVPGQPRRDRAGPIRRSAAAASICRSRTGQAERRNRRPRVAGKCRAAPRPRRESGGRQADGQHCAANATRGFEPRQAVIGCLPFGPATARARSRVRHGVA